MRIIYERHHAFAPFACDMILAIEQITDSFLIFSPDTPTKLMKLRKSEVLRICDEDRVRTEKIHAIFDDRRRDEDIIFSPLKCMDSGIDLIS